MSIISTDIRKSLRRFANRHSQCVEYDFSDPELLPYRQTALSHWCLRASLRGRAWVLGSRRESSRAVLLDDIYSAQVKQTQITIYLGVEETLKIHWPYSINSTTISAHNHRLRRSCASSAGKTSISMTTSHGGWGWSHECGHSSMSLTRVEERRFEKCS